MGRKELKVFGARPSGLETGDQARGGTVPTGEDPRGRGSGQGVKKI